MHKKVFYHKSGTTGNPQKCKQCDREETGEDEEHEILEVQFLAEGGYSHLWLVTFIAKPKVEPCYKLDQWRF